MESNRDLYRILNVSPSASAEEIKKSFRKLALQYHPDKHNNSSAANARFTELNAAYHILSDNKKRADYNYSKYLSDPFRSGRPQVYSAEDMLKISAQYYEDISRSNHFTIDRDLLYFQLLDLLSDQNLSLISEANDTALNRKIILNLLPALRHLPPVNIDIVVSHLNKITGRDNTMLEEILREATHAKQSYYWNRYKILFALVIAVIACLMIYLAK